MPGKKVHEVEKTSKPTARRPRRTSAEIRGRILAAAREEFANHGYAGATTRQIALCADVAEPLVFNNFGTKAALFQEAVVAPFSDRFSAFLESTSSMPCDREYRSGSFVRTLYPFLRENAAALLALAKSAGEIDSGNRHGLDGYFAEAETRMKQRYDIGGLEFDVPPYLLVRYAFGMLAGAALFRDWFFASDIPDEAVAEAALARMLFKAVEPRSTRAAAI